ncbi:MAG: hypothetical protein ABSC51_12135 [Gaiellaceae bacterium]
MSERSRQANTWNGFDRLGVVALVDPPSLTKEQETTLETVGSPTHILLTCDWYLRESLAHRKRFGCELLINSVAKVEHPVDGTFSDGECL